MPVIHAADAVVHDLHGARFTSYASSVAGSAELCVWRLELPEVGAGAPHRISREEVFVFTGGAGTGSLNNNKYIAIEASSHNVLINTLTTGAGPSTVPEPRFYGLLLAGLLGLAGTVYRRRRVTE